MRREKTTREAQQEAYSKKPSVPITPHRRPWHSLKTDNNRPNQAIVLTYAPHSILGFLVLLFCFLLMNSPLIWTVSQKPGFVVCLFPAGCDISSTTQLNAASHMCLCVYYQEANTVNCCVHEFAHTGKHKYTCACMFYPQLNVLNGRVYNSVAKASEIWVCTGVTQN